MHGSVLIWLTNLTDQILMCVCVFFPFLGIDFLIHSLVKYKIKNKIIVCRKWIIYFSLINKKCNEFKNREILVNFGT